MGCAAWGVSALAVGCEPRAACVLHIDAVAGEAVTLRGLDVPGWGHRWSVVSDAPGSVLSGADTAAPTFTAWAVGEVLLRDAMRGATGRSQRCAARVRARPAAGLRVELTWPRGEAPLDLDLHLRRSGGRWFHPPEDCFYLDRSPRWDAARPTLDRDARGGGDVEVLRVTDPVEGAEYEVGVHAFEGPGSARATLRIYCGDGARVTLTRDLDGGWALAGDGAFWQAAAVTWRGPGACAVRPLGQVLRAADARRGDEGAP